MNTQIEALPEDQRRFIYRCNALTGMLDAEYTKRAPIDNRKNFKAEVFPSILEFVSKDSDINWILDHEQALTMLAGFAAEQNSPELYSDIAWIYFSCAYCVASVTAFETGEPDIAWDLQCQAHLFLGMVLVTNPLEQVFTETIVKDYRSTFSAKGADKVNRAHEHWKSVVHQAVRNGSPWSELSDAVSCARAALVAKTITSYSDETIEGWIKKMPDIDQICPIYAQRRDRQKGKAISAG